MVCLSSLLRNAIDLVMDVNRVTGNVDVDQ